MLRWGDSLNNQRDEQRNGGLTFMIRENEALILVPTSILERVRSHKLRRVEGRNFGRRRHTNYRNYSCLIINHTLSYRSMLRSLHRFRDARFFSSCSGLRTLPAHKIVGLPALSPVSENAPLIFARMQIVLRRASRVISPICILFHHPPPLPFPDRRALTHIDDAIWHNCRVAEKGGRSRQGR